MVATTKVYDQFSKTEIISNSVTVQSKTGQEQTLGRASFPKKSGRILRRMPRLSLSEEGFEALKIPTFVCRIISLSSNQFSVQELESSMGDDMISKFLKAKAKSGNPGIIVCLTFTDKESFFGFSKKSNRTERQKKCKVILMNPLEVNRNHA